MPKFAIGAGWIVFVLAVGHYIYLTVWAIQSGGIPPSWLMNQDAFIAFAGIVLILLGRICVAVERGSDKPDP